jgi:hypothetical protein
MPIGFDAVGDHHCFRNSLPDKELFMRSPWVKGSSDSVANLTSQSDPLCGKV